MLIFLLYYTLFASLSRNARLSRFRRQRAICTRNAYAKRVIYVWIYAI